MSGPRRRRQRRRRRRRNAPRTTPHLAAPRDLAASSTDVRPVQSRAFLWLNLWAKRGRTVRVALHLPSQSASHPSGLPAAKHTHTLAPPRPPSSLSRSSSRGSARCVLRVCCVGANRPSPTSPALQLRPTPSVCRRPLNLCCAYLCNQSSRIRAAPPAQPPALAGVSQAKATADPHPLSSLWIGRIADQAGPAFSLSYKALGTQMAAAWVFLCSSFALPFER